MTLYIYGSILCRMGRAIHKMDPYIGDLVHPCPNLPAGVLLHPCPNLPAGVLSPDQNSYSPMGWTGLPMGFSHVPILKYTSKSQCPVLSYSPVGWTGLSMGFSHVPSFKVPYHYVFKVPYHCTIVKSEMAL